MKRLLFLLLLISSSLVAQTTKTTLTPAQKAAQKAFQNGNEFLKLHKYDSALACYNRALRFSPSDDALQARATCKAALGNDTGAFNDYDRLVKKHPENASYWYSRAVYRAAGSSVSNDSVLIDVNKAIALRPDYGDAHLFRGGLLLKLHRRTAGISDYTIVIERFPNDPFSYLERARGLAMCTQYGLARCDLNDYRRHNGDTTAEEYRNGLTLCRDTIASSGVHATMKQLSGTWTIDSVMIDTLYDSDQHHSKRIRSTGLKQLIFGETLCTVTENDNVYNDYALVRDYLLVEHFGDKLPARWTIESIAGNKMRICIPQDLRWTKDIRETYLYCTRKK